MRIISGKYGGRRFRCDVPPGTRPTTDRLKETIFNMLVNHIEIENCVVMDLYAGAGALGFEAISRGAAFCVFVDKSEKTNTIMKQIAAELCLKDDDYKLMKMSVATFLNKSKEIIPDLLYDLIFLDPPYHKGLADEALNLIVTNKLLSDDGIIVTEIASTDVCIVPDELEVFARRSAGDSQTLFFRIKR
jgi:16S rRNA (guanine966-N2)-methyltransferase